MDAVSAAWAVKQYSVVKMGVGIGVGVGTRVLGVLIAHKEEVLCLSEAVSLFKLEEDTHDMTLDVIICKMDIQRQWKRICT